MPQNSVHALLQTSDGYLWMGTEGGLARFNGYQFRIFDRDSVPRIAGNDVRCLLEDRFHALWIGTSSGLTRLKDGVAQTYTTADGLTSDSVRSLLMTADGNLWVLTAQGLSSTALRDGKDAGTFRFRSYGQHNGTSSERVNAIAKASGGDGIWAATDRGLNRIRGTGVEQGPSTAVGVSIDALISDDAGVLFFATADGVFQRKDNAVTQLATRDALPVGGIAMLLATPGGVWAAGKSSLILIQPHGIATFKTGRELPGDQIETIFEDRKGAVWIGTNRGVARWWKGQMDSSLSGTALLSLYEDRDGDVWLGTETEGAIALRERPFEFIGRAQGLGEGAATSMVGSGDGLWAGTDGGGVSYIGGATAHLRTVTVKNGLPSDTVLALAAGNHDGTDLWVGTPDGLGHLENSRIRNYGTADGLADDFVRSLIVARDGAVWIGTRHGVTRWQDGRANTWTTVQGLGSDLIGAMVEDATGDVWIATLHGLSRIHSGAITNYTVTNGLPGDTITALANGSDGTLWIGTKGKGLAARDGQRFFSYTAVPALPKTIFAILEDGHGFLWLSSDRGLDRVTLSDLAAFRAGTLRTIDVTHYGTSDGLGSSEGSDAGHPSAVRLQDGRLCFATRRGIVAVDPELFPARHLAPPVSIEQMTADDHEVSREQLASMPPGPSHFTFTFAGINLAAPQRLQYRYMLEGFDRDWVDAGTRRTAFYTNLPPGRYRFRVNARYGSEPWSERDSAVNMVLRPRFYQTAWFRAGMLVVLVAVLFCLYQLRLRTIQNRFDAVAAERNRLAREIHDTLAQGFVAVSVRLEILSQILHGSRMEESREQLNQTRSLVQESLNEARRSIWNLRAEGAESESLPARLARSVQGIIARGVDSQLDTTGVYRALDARMEDELYRIAQEAIANALQHAEASEILIELVYAQDLIRLKITDDGRGFDITSAPSRDQGHFGLTGLQERAQQIGATLLLDSAPGHGTTVLVESSIARDGKK